VQLNQARRKRLRVIPIKPSAPVPRRISDDGSGVVETFGISVATSVSPLVKVKVPVRSVGDDVDPAKRGICVDSGRVMLFAST
jgi:hypothetical protein